MYEYDPYANAWAQLANFTGGIRAYATTFMIDGEGYMGMGFGTVMHNDLWKVGGIPTSIAEHDEGTPWLMPSVNDGRFRVLLPDGLIRAQLLVIDVRGRSILEERILGPVSEVNASLPPGQYVVRLVGNDVVRTERMVMQ